MRGALNCQCFVPSLRTAIHTFLELDSTSSIQHSNLISGIHDPKSSAILIALGMIMYTDVTAVAQLDSRDVMVMGMEVIILAK